ncbi:hypothetical protein KY345_01210 [Candidatus Woesearchaeota archaeon]|nr:hypothetical protein [Candidatus Woesearchaeota archaeon]
MSSETLVQRVRTGIKRLMKESRNRREERIYIKRNTWCGLVPGDLVEISGIDLMYRCLDRQGGPGMAHYAMMGIYEPQFTLPFPTHPQLFVYLRPEGLGLPMEVFGQNLPPAGIGNEGARVAFLNDTGRMSKFGHLTQDEYLAGEYLKRYAERHEEVMKRIEEKRMLADNSGKP